MATARHRLMRQQALWHAAAASGMADVDWDLFYRCGSLQKTPEIVVPYSDKIIQDLIDRGLLS